MNCQFRQHKSSVHRSRQFVLCYSTASQCRQSLSKETIHQLKLMTLWMEGTLTISLCFRRFQVGGCRTGISILDTSQYLWHSRTSPRCAYQLLWNGLNLLLSTSLHCSREFVMFSLRIISSMFNKFVSSNSAVVTPVIPTNDLGLTMRPKTNRASCVK